MFDIGWGEFLVLIVAGLFILGPERVPEAAAWLGRTVRQVRTYAGGVQEQLRTELGPDFDEIRKPLGDLRALRNFDAKGMVTKHLLDATGGYDPREDLRITTSTMDHTSGAQSNGFPADSTTNRVGSLSPGERPPFDPDAT